MIFDTETFNTLDDPLFYDIGGIIIDKQGNEYASFRFVNSDVYYGCSWLGNTAYYANKLPDYDAKIKSGEIQVKNTYQIKAYIERLCKEWNIKAVIAHNAYFDYKATATTQRYVTKSKYRYFLPYGIEIWDSLKMAKSTICKQKSYIQFCRENGYTYGKNQTVRATAEILYRYMTWDTGFIEEHTALDDSRIEAQIVARCFRQHKKMNKKLFKDKVA